MTFKQLKHKIKEEQKALAQLIKRGKQLRKPCNRKDITEEDRSHYYTAYGDSDGFSYWKIESLGDDYRHTHIAYCQFFNKTPYDMIERSCHEDPRKSTIKNYMKNWESQIDEEALRDCA